MKYVTELSPWASHAVKNVFISAVLSKQLFFFFMVKGPASDAKDAPQS
jgi:hypothetical protein